MILWTSLKEIGKYQVTPNARLAHILPLRVYIPAIYVSVSILDSQNEAHSPLQGSKQGLPRQTLAKTV